MATQILEQTGRIIVKPGKVRRLPNGSVQMWVRAGTAWITANGKDIIVPCGHQRMLDADRDGAFVSGLQDQPLIMDVERVLTLAA